jgi:REP element-mobilizing transposase RayT
MERRRKSNRLAGFDYSLPGAYFVTVCALNRACCFGRIDDGHFVPNRLGEIVLRLWRQTLGQFGGLVEDVCCLMPNHFHAIVAIADTQPGREQLRRAVVPAIMQAFKSRTTIEAGRLGLLAPGLKLWQADYYDHIVRNDRSLERIREYIVNNPAQWSLDIENAQRSATGEFYGWLRNQGKIIV